MPKFDDLLNTIGVGEDGVTPAYPDSFVTDISTAYAEDMAIPNAKIDVLTAENAALVAENLALKAHNYDLLMQVPATDPEDGDTGENGDADSDADDDEDAGTDSLFTDKEDEDA